MSKPPTIAVRLDPSGFDRRLIRIPSSTYAIRDPSGDHATSPIR